MHRPKKWEEIVKKVLEETPQLCWGDGSVMNASQNRLLIEAGADAMLEGLRNDGVQFDLKKGDVLTLSPAIVTNLLGRPIGKMVLIPDEEEDEG